MSAESPTAVTRLLVVSDLAGSDAVWRKLVNAVSLNVYKADAALLAGGLGVDVRRAREWTELAAERLHGVPVPLCVIPGPADDPAIDAELTAVTRNPVCVDGRPYPLPGGLTVIADSMRPGTTPAPAERLATLAATGADGPVVLMTAAVPYDERTGEGSREVAKAIARIRPAVSVHGLGLDDFDEPPDPKRLIGSTIALTPGSDAADGGLSGFAVDLAGGGVRVARPFRT